MRTMRVEALSFLTSAFQLLVQRSSRTIVERRMVVPDILEVVDLIAWKEKSDADGVYGCVTPTFVVEFARCVERVEKLAIGM